jgi:hypothetical protein
VLNLSESAARLEKFLPQTSEYITDGQLRELSNINEPEYSKAKKELVESGIAVIGRGRGGPIRRAGTRKQQILARLPRDGAFISNNKIYEPLNMTPEEYAEILEELLSEGLVVVGRGRYGRTARANGANGSQDFSFIDRRVSNENELFQHVKEYFDRKWKHNYEPSPPNLYISEITSMQYPRMGITKIPDISILTIMKYDFVPGNHLEVITIEVRKHQELNLTSVYETASMNLISHRSYLVFEWLDEEDYLTADPNSELLFNEAKRFGIGLVQMQPVDSEKWAFKILLEPRLTSPELGELNSFIEVRFKSDQARIRGALA